MWWCYTNYAPDSEVGRGPPFTQLASACGTKFKPFDVGPSAAFLFAANWEGVAPQTPQSFGPPGTWAISKLVQTPGESLFGLGMHSCRARCH